MREIKFRAWDCEAKEMIDTPDLYNWEGFNEFMGTDFCSSPIFMQYTGLKDNNGKEIYESDILRFGDTAHEKGCYCDHCWPKCPTGTVALVVWLSAGFQIIPLSAYPEQDGTCQECSSYGGLLSPNHEMEIGYFTEIIGNIYENPELLKEK